MGLAFQVIDDILDVTQTSEQLGKTAGKDSKAQKATYPSIVGLEVARDRRELTNGPLGRSNPFAGGLWPSRRWRSSCSNGIGEPD